SNLAIRGGSADARPRLSPSARRSRPPPSRRHRQGEPMILGVHPLIALGVLASTAATDAAYVFFNAAVSGRRRVMAANWSAIWYMLSAFAVISYTENAIYRLFAAAGSV